MQILVLGMHRSGTSAITQLIRMMGAWLGDKDHIMPPHAHDNPAGYWERTAIVDAHVRILHALDPATPPRRTWFQISQFDPRNLTRLSNADVAPLADEIAALNLRRPWVVKDPRLCLLLPLWQRMLDAPVYVLIHRDPLEVAASLSSRTNEPLPFGFGLALWEKYVLSALRALEGQRVIVVSHARLMADPWLECVRLLRYLAERVGGLQLPDRAAVEASIDPALHRARREGIDAALWLTRQQSDICVELEALAALPGAVELRTRAPACRMPDARIAEYERLEFDASRIADAERHMAARDALIEDQRLRLDACHAKVEQQHVQIAARDIEIDEQRRKLAAADSLSDGQRAQLIAAASAEAAHAAALRALEIAIDDMRGRPAIATLRDAARALEKELRAAMPPGH